MDNNSSAASTMVLSSVTTRTLPAWLTPVAFGVVGLVLMGLVGLISPNLGAAAIAIGIASFVIAAIGLVFLALDKSFRSQWAITALILAAIGAVALLGNGAAYGFTIAQSERQGNYGAAVTELKAIGKAPPFSTDLAQVYLDWANAEVQTKAFAAAVTHFSYVAQNFQTLPQAAKAQAALPGTYLSWAKYATAQNDPITAGQEYQVLLTQYAASPEATTAHGLAPAAYLAWGDAEFKANYYAQAYTAYTLISKGFPKDALAATAHTSAAKVLAAWAQSLTTAHLFSDASVHFTDLAKNYADTPEGKNAQKLLTQGVQIIGRLLRSDGTTPIIASTTVRLSTVWNVPAGSPSNYSVSGQQYVADTDANGYFVFPSVPSGQYLLEWRSTLGPYETLFNGDTPLEIVTIHPLDAPTLPAITTNEK